ncbi:hypothetical protein [Mycolicibacterium hippocampi]|uniref:hypothetical protein n=1 Tax=Mycolicibacterium hippocampi TaxID=659824 RepID=UPI0035138838
MSTLRLYLRIQAMTFVFGIVGPIFLVGYFTAQPDPTLRWMYWWGLFITTADILIALAIVDMAVRAERRDYDVPPEALHPREG